MSFYEKHYSMCQKYIHACSNPDKYTHKELLEITNWAKKYNLLVCLKIIS